MLFEPLDLKGKKVFVYRRVSTRKQLNDNDLSNQTFHLEKRAKELELIIAKVFTDSAISGKDVELLAERKQMIEELLSNNDITGILVTDLDRLGRSAIDLGQLIDTVTNKHKKIILDLRGSYETNTIEGLIKTQMLVLFAELERRWLKARLDRGKERAKAEGIKFGRKEKELDEKRIIELYNSGLGCTKLAKHFNVSPNTIRQRLIKNKIQLRSFREK